MPFAKRAPQSAMQAPTRVYLWRSDLKELALTLMATLTGMAAATASHAASHQWATRPPALWSRRHQPSRARRSGTDLVELMLAGFRAIGATMRPRRWRLFEAVENRVSGAAAWIRSRPLLGT